jgi:tetratricopeptide (TPR) repeat protein
MRLAGCILATSPTEARGMVGRALELYESLGDIRGQARCQNSMGVIAQFESRVSDARAAFDQAMSMAKLAGMPDIGGSAALNLGVLLQKHGEFEKARGLFSDAMTSFAAVRNSEFQLIALFNMASNERELGAFESAAELYSTTSSLADRIGHGDMEIGALAGAGMCYLGLGQLDRARSVGGEVHQRLERRPGWYQGRELAEALIVRVMVLNGELAEALTRFETAVNTAESVDVYTAIWLTLACAEALSPADPTRVKFAIDRYSVGVRKLGYDELTRRYDALAGR